MPKPRTYETIIRDENGVPTTWGAMRNQLPKIRALPRVSKDVKRRLQATASTNSPSKPTTEIRELSNIAQPAEKEEVLELCRLVIQNPAMDFTRKKALEVCNLQSMTLDQKELAKIIEKNSWNVDERTVLPNDFVQILKEFPSEAVRIREILLKAILPITYQTKDAQPTEDVIREMVTAISEGLKNPEKTVNVPFLYALYKSENIVFSGGSAKIDLAEAIFLKRLQRSAAKARSLGLNLEYVLMNEAPYAGASDGVSPEEIEWNLTAMGVVLGDKPGMRIRTEFPPAKFTPTEDRGKKQVRAFVRSMSQKQLANAGVPEEAILARDKEMLRGSSNLSNTALEITAMAEACVDRFTAGKKWTLENVRDKLLACSPGIYAAVLRTDKRLSIDTSGSMAGESRFPTYGLAVLTRDNRYLGVLPFADIVANTSKYVALLDENGIAWAVKQIF